MSTKDLNFWLEEKDLKTPKHDELVLWTFNNAENILKELKIYPSWSLTLNEKTKQSTLYDLTSSWLSEETKEEHRKDNLDSIQRHLEQMDLYNSLAEQFKNKEFDKFFSISWNKTIEFPLKGYNGFNLGFIDLMIIPQIKTSNCMAEPIKGTGYGTGYINDGYHEQFKFAFEIKPQVKSIGEVLRQFQFYKSNLPNGCALILVTGTKGLKEIFESQGFYVVEYKGGGNGN